MIQLAYGTVGSGKSTLLHDLVAAQSKYQRFLCMDHEQGWHSEGVHWRGKPPTIYDIEKEGVIPDFREFGVYRFRSIQWDPREVAQMCLDMPYDCCYVDDEIDKAGRKEGFDTSPLRKILNEGRHIETSDGNIHQVHLLGGCRRPQKLHRDFDLAYEFFIFRVQGSTTLKRLRDDACVEDNEWDRIRMLPNFQFKFHSGGRNEFLSIPCLAHNKHNCQLRSPHDGKPCAGEFSSAMPDEDED
jgi:hypothetical protein